MKIAVIGSGIAGLASAWKLASIGHEISLFEANDYFGGHTHTVDVELDGLRYGVDTGFLVFNHHTYPHLVRLFQTLQIDTSSTDMSFSVKLPLSQKPGARMLEWAGANLDTVFVQRRNLGSLRFLRMLRDIVRFNRHSTQLASAVDPEKTTQSLGDFLKAQRYSAEFRDWYLLPMAGCIWSCPTEQMLAFPLTSFVRFCHNHGLLQVSNRPQWQTVTGGAKHYVEKMLSAITHKHLNAPVRAVSRRDFGTLEQVCVEVQGASHLFDHVVLATHSDQSLALLTDASPDEKRILSAVTYQPNEAVLHTDTRCLPTNKNAWSAWNYESAGGNEPHVCVHYLINKLQPLPFKTPVIVSLNPINQPAASTVLGRFTYAHPVFDRAAIAAQQALPAIQGRHHTWFAGAWTGYGFHEDGLKSGLAVADSILAQEALAPTVRVAA